MPLPGTHVCPQAKCILVHAVRRGVRETNIGLRFLIELDPLYKTGEADFSYRRSTAYATTWNPRVPTGQYAFSVMLFLEVCVKQMSGCGF